MILLKILFVYLFSLFIINLIIYTLSILLNYYQFNLYFINNHSKLIIIYIVIIKQISFKLNIIKL